MAEKTKAELLAEARSKGLDVSDSNTRDEIQAALDEAPASTPSAPPEPESDAAEAPETKGEAPTAASFLKHLDSIDREELVQLRNTLDQYLAFRGADPGTPGPDLRQKAMAVPTLEDHDYDVKTVAKATDTDLADVVDFNVRQATDVRGNGVGDAYGVVVTNAGEKKVAVLS